MISSDSWWGLEGGGVRVQAAPPRFRFDVSPFLFDILVKLCEFLLGEMQEFQIVCVRILRNEPWGPTSWPFGPRILFPRTFLHALDST